MKYVGTNDHLYIIRHISCSDHDSICVRSWVDPFYSLPYRLPSRAFHDKNRFTYYWIGNTYRHLFDPLPNHRIFSRTTDAADFQEETGCPWRFFRTKRLINEPSVRL